MIRNVLSDIGGVGLYGVISVLLFFTVFTVALAWACCLRRPFLDAMGQLPLADDHRSNVKTGEARHE
jgi:hypothetical protein